MSEQIRITGCRGCVEKRGEAVFAQESSKMFVILSDASLHLSDLSVLVVQNDQSDAESRDEDQTADDGSPGH